MNRRGVDATLGLLADYQPIHRAILRGDLAAIDKLVEAEGPALLDLRLATCGGAAAGGTPLLVAAFSGRAPAVARLLAHGAQTRPSTRHGGSAAHWACVGDSVAALGIVLVADPQALNARTNDGETPLNVAAFHNARRCLSLLLGRYGDALELDAKDRQGWTAVCWAAMGDNLGALKLLLQAGASPATTHDVYHCTRADLRELVKAALTEPERAQSLLRCRALLDAAGAVPRARSDVRRRGLLPVERQKTAVAAALVYLKQRVRDGLKLPQVALCKGQGSEALVACVKYALGLEGGGGVVVEGFEPQQGMVKEVFVELCEMLAPKWKRDEM